MRAIDRQIQQQATAEWQARADASPTDTYVYRYFDAAGALLYVGATKDLDKRDGQHKRSARWRARAVERTVQGPFPSQVALGLEQAAIRDEAPLHNRYRNNGYAGPGSLPWHQRVADLWDELPESVRIEAASEALENFAAHLGLAEPIT